jgi:beta-phosphoglucomutase
MFRGVIFDMDGVIVDSHPSHKKAWRKFLHAMGKEVSDDELEFILEGHTRKHILRHFLGDLSESQLVEYGNRKDQFFREVGTDADPVAGAVEFIEHLKQSNIGVAVATSASRQRTSWTLERLKLTSYFEAVVTADEVVQSKPDPLVYSVAAKRLGLCPEQIIAFEDSIAGIMSAKSAGLRCVGVADQSKAETLRRGGADHVVPNFVGLRVSELEQLLASCTVASGLSS